MESYDNSRDIEDPAKMNSFKEELIQFMNENGCTNFKVPQIAGGELNLFKLYNSPLTTESFFFGPTGQESTLFYLIDFSSFAISDPLPIELCFPLFFKIENFLLLNLDPFP